MRQVQDPSFVHLCKELRLQLFQKLNPVTPLDNDGFEVCKFFIAPWPVIPFATGMQTTLAIPQVH